MYLAILVIHCVVGVLRLPDMRHRCLNAFACFSGVFELRIPKYWAGREGLGFIMSELQSRINRS